MLSAVALDERSGAFVRPPMQLERLLTSPFPVPGGAEEIRRSFTADLGRDSLGPGVHQGDQGIPFEFPAVVLAGSKRG